MKSLMLFIFSTLFSMSLFAGVTRYDANTLECSIRGRNIEISQNGNPIMTGHRLLRLTALSWLDQCEKTLREAQVSGERLYILDQQLSHKPRQNYKACLCKINLSDRDRSKNVLVLFDVGATDATVLQEARLQCAEVYRLRGNYLVQCPGIN